MAQKDSRPRRSCTPSSVSTSVATVCTQALWVFTLVPVSSAWITGEARSWSVTASMKGPRRKAASCCTWHSQPVDTPAPSISLSNSAVRSRGMC